MMDEMEDGECATFADLRDLMGWFSE